MIFCFKCIKMNEIVSIFLLVGDRFMPMHLKPPGFTYSACGPLTKNKERIEKICRQEIQTSFIKTILIKLVLSL